MRNITWTIVRSRVLFVSAVLANVATPTRSTYEVGDLGRNYVQTTDERGSRPTTEPGDGSVTLGQYKSSKKHLSINNTEVNEAVIESESNIPAPLSNLTVSPSNRSDIIENFTSYYEATCNNRSELILNSEQRNDSRVSEHLSAAGIAGITLSCVFVVGVVMVLSYIVYKNRGSNRPQVLNDHCSNLDSSGYIDDTSVRVRSW